MYRVSPELPKVHRNVLRFQRRRLASKRGEGFSGMGERSVKGLVNASARWLIQGHEQQVYDGILSAASWLTGREIIGCGEESLVTKIGDNAIKFATKPSYDARDVVDELKRRHDIAMGYIGRWIVDTQYEVGGLQVGEQLVPKFVVITQPFVHIGPGIAAQSPNIGEYREEALRLASDHKIGADLYTGTDNMVLDTEAEIRLLDTTMVSADQNGKPGLLSPHLCDFDANVTRLQWLGRAS